MVPIIDLHQDLLLYTTRPELFKDTNQTSFEKIKENNLKIVTVSAFPVPPEENFFNPISNDMIEEDLQTYLEHVTKHPEFVIIKKKEDVTRVMETEDLFGLILHIEGLNVFDEKSGWSMLERWYEIGLRSVGPVWNLANPFGGGDKDENKGLTDLGKKLVTWCEERGLLLDFAHMNAPTFWDTTKIVSRPILISHGNAATLCPRPRNYTDEQLHAVGESGGVVGLLLGKKFLTSKDNAGIEAVLDQIAHIESVAGKDALAIGSDFGGILSGFVDGLHSVDDVQTVLPSTPEDVRELFAYKNAERILMQLL